MNTHGSVSAKVRVGKEEWERWRRLARESGMTISAWIRTQLAHAGKIEIRVSHEAA